MLNRDLKQAQRKLLYSEICGLYPLFWKKAAWFFNLWPTESWWKDPKALAPSGGWDLQRGFCLLWAEILTYSSGWPGESLLRALERIPSRPSDNIRDPPGSRLWGVDGVAWCLSLTWKTHRHRLYRCSEWVTCLNHIKMVIFLITFPTLEKLETISSEWKTRHGRKMALSIPLLLSSKMRERS